MIKRRNKQKSRLLKKRDLNFMKNLSIILSLVIFSMPAGCKEEKYGLRFNHALHVQEQKLSCTDCHQHKESAFIRPEHDNCISCHRELIENEKPSADTCGVCHRETDFDEIGKEKTDSAYKGIFKHTTQLKNSCLECHDNIIKEGDSKIKQVDILQIRQKAHNSPIKCDACHSGMDRNTPPANHVGNWKHSHGELGDSQDAVCSICHQKQSCDACHAKEKPSSHTVLWTQTHGIEGSWDRERCTTCHRNESCVVCHREVKPRSHYANWGKTHGVGAKSGSSNCTVCHEQQSCDACHRSTQPANHKASFARNHANAAKSGSANCLTCHTQQYCDACHRSNR